MNSRFKQPLLAAKAPEDLSKLRYPLMVSPKLDGFRCVKVEGKALSRTFKPIPNDYVRNWIQRWLPDGLDGELMQRNLTAPFDETSGMMRRKAGVPNFVFAAFDWFNIDDLDEPFCHRYDRLRHWVDLDLRGLGRDPTDPGHFYLVPQAFVQNAEELMMMHEGWTSSGFEGTMIRDPAGVYKCGRSTVREQILIKLKNWVDEEAIVIGIEEQLRNDNPATVDATGHTKRSHHQENKVGKGTMGKLRCRLDDGTEFGLGTGFDDKLKQEIWNTRRNPITTVIGGRVKFKHQLVPGGRQPGQAPRIPAFLGFRDLSLD